MSLLQREGVGKQGTLELRSEGVTLQGAEKSGPNSAKHIVTLKNVSNPTEV